MKYFSDRNKAIVSELVRADFKIRYQGSMLGYAWSLLRPLLLFSVLYVMFVYVLPVGNSVKHFPVYLLTGVIFWNFFCEATIQGLASVVSRGELIRKINLPKYLLVISSAMSALINLGFGLIVLIIFALFNHVMPSIQWLMLVPLVFEMFIFTVGISFLLSSLYVKYKDISYIWEVVLQVGFYASAIIFPLSVVPVEYQKIFFLNPVVQIVQDARYFLASNDSIVIWNTVGLLRICIPFIIIAATIVIGGVVFRIKAKSFAEDI